MAWYINNLGYEVWIDGPTWERINIRGDAHLFQRRVPKDIGEGPANKLAILFNSHRDNRGNGIGDYVHCMPGLSEKAKTHEIDVWSSEFFRPLVESTGARFKDSEALHVGIIHELKKDYGEVHSLVHWCIIHDEETQGDVFVDRFKQFGNFIEQRLPESYSWRDVLGVTKRSDKSGPVGIGLQSTSPHRTYIRMQEVASGFPNSVIFGGGNAHKEVWMQTAKTLPELIEQLLRCSVVIAVDNGILALCLALEIPVLAVFGPTEENSIVWQFARYVDMGNVRVLTSQVEDDYCTRACSLQLERGWGVNGKCRTEADCMKEISPRSIVDAANELINSL